ncbi:peptidoglycan bridge formation glycyltransferase FemA/FemB family protein [Flavihumibacter stibioxidans]|uniref:Peptidoglycan bridge formation glycyltransferase FemA/FemB family protein n=1 Tax=Flavihumibacter stibioxidans TaxID=1834163 RepID=A0ABR7M4M1_9BACT|nr:peptidoglycan bridge formation glycyltransferase FemA/FemB family protein [Flavihumibacter stibioxidans]MBC6489949.1 hypothetical protein [Flavihumibacter stibioxidans]
MASYKVKYMAIPVGVSWFSASQSAIDHLLPNVYYHVKESGGKQIIGQKEISRTLEIDLTQAEETLHAAFLKSYRQQIRQAEEEGVTCYFKDDEIGFFAEFFNQFARNKKIHTVTPERLTEMKRHLRLSFASYNGVVLAAHSYIVDNDLKIVRAFHSATRRLEDSVERNRVGKANKLLHYKDMLEFKRQGYEIYDFGGIAMDSDNPELKGINDFKLGFGGKVVDCDNFYSYGYVLLRKLSRIFKLTSETSE